MPRRLASRRCATATTISSSASIRLQHLSVGVHLDDAVEDQFQLSVPSPRRSGGSSESRGPCAGETSVSHRKGRHLHCTHARLRSPPSKMVRNRRSSRILGMLIGYEIAVMVLKWRIHLRRGSWPIFAIEARIGAQGDNRSERHLHFAPTIPVQTADRRARDPAVLIASSARIERELGWRPLRRNWRRSSAAPGNICCCRGGLISVLSSVGTLFGRRRVPHSS